MDTITTPAGTIDLLGGFDMPGFVGPPVFGGVPKPPKLGYPLLEFGDFAQPVKTRQRYKPDITSLAFDIEGEASDLSILMGGPRPIKKRRRKRRKK
jgi:hypothetical protein